MYYRTVNGYTYSYAGEDPDTPKPGAQQPEDVTMRDITTVAASAANVKDGFAALDAALSVINENVKTNSVQSSDIQGVLSALTQLGQNTQRMTREIEANLCQKLGAESRHISKDLTENANDVLQQIDETNVRIEDLTSKYDAQVSYVRQILTSVQGFPSEIEKVFYQCSLVQTELSKLRDNLREIAKKMRDAITEVLISESNAIKSEVKAKHNELTQHVDELHTANAVKEDKRTDYLFTLTTAVIGLKALGDVCNSLFKKEK